MNKDGFYGSGGAGSATPIGGGGVGNSDVNWRLDQLVLDMNIMWAKIAELETTLENKSEPYDVMDSFRSSKIERDAGEPANRYFVDCLKENAKLVEENDVLKYQYETMHNETVRCKAQLDQFEKIVADKQKVLDGEKAAAIKLEESSTYWQQKYNKLHRELEDVKKSNEYLRGTLKNYEDRFAELEKANKYWEDLCQRLQMENADLNYRTSNFEIVEKQTARACLALVTKIKNEPLTMMSPSREWMVAICEDIERVIKQEYGLK